MTVRSLDGDPRESRVNGLALIEARIRQRLGGQVSDLQVAIRDDGVVLRGRTRTHHARQVALQIVLDMTDLPIRAAEIRAGNRSPPIEPRAAMSPAGPFRDREIPEPEPEPAGEARDALFARMGERRVRARARGH